jgi:glycine/D-amino acid oxidase-like deaminating enzyme
MTTPDVAVIGGGIVGTATAALLAGSGARVRLYEREAVAAGASGRNSGVVQRPFDAALAPLYEETIALYRDLAAEVEGGARLPDAPAGLLLVSHHAPLVRRLADELNAGTPGLGAEALEGPALRSLEPALAPEVVACRVPIGFPVPPGAGTYAFATLAERRGALIRLGRAAVPLVEGGRAVGVVVEGRVEPAGAVVVAAGPWTPALVDPTGRWRPIRPLWGVVVETELAGPPGHVLEEAEMDAALGTGDLAAEAGVEADDPGTTPEFSLVTAGGVSAVGSTFLDDEPDPEAWTERILRRGVRFVLGLLDAPIREVRACARPLSADGRPLIGAVPWAQGLYVCSGHGPWGISTGPGSARLVADLALGRPVTVPEAFDPGRFGSP